MNKKIIDVNELKNYQDFVLTYGHFTTIHPGHIRYLKYAKSLASKLVIALKGDLTNGVDLNLPYEFSQSERAESLLMLDIADAIIFLKKDELSQIIQETNPKLVILGKQFENSMEEEVIASTKILSKKGIQLIFHGGDISYSNNELLTSPDYEVLRRKKEEFISACNFTNITVSKS